MLGSSLRPIPSSRLRSGVNSTVTLGRMPSPREPAATLEEAVLESVLGGFRASVTEASPRPITNLVWPLELRPLAMLSSTGRPFTRAEIAASVPGIEIDCTEPPVLLSEAPSLATAAWESAGFLEPSTIAARRLTTVLPLAKSPAELIQLRKSCWVCAPGELSADSGVRTPSSTPLMLKPPTELASDDEPVAEAPPSEVISEARPCSACASSASVTPTWPRPRASQDSPGSSLRAWAPSAPEATSPPLAAAVPDARLSTSSAIELDEGTSETFSWWLPPSSPSTLPRPGAPLPDAPPARDDPPPADAL